MLEKDIESVLVSEEEIARVTKELGQQLTKDYATKNPIIVGLLKGCVPFMADLLKHLNFYLEMGFMDVSSYHGGTTSSGEVKIDMDLSIPVKGRHILIAEDIVDSGRTLEAVVGLLKHRGAESVKVVTLLDKPAGRVVDYKADYIGVTIPQAFVVGYGLDFNEMYRNLPYVGTLKPEVYSTDKE